MKYVLDTHTHTLASGHAYSTVREMAKMAADKGLEALGITDHAPQMPGTCHEFHFANLRVLERKMYGVELLHGVELNIMDTKGSVDLPEWVLRQMDITIASMHTPCYESAGKEGNTAAYVAVMRNPYIDIIGHPDDGRYPVDYELLAKAAKEHHVLLELNNSSLDPLNARENCEENAALMLKYCKQFQVPVVVGSDAHADTQVGSHERALKLIREVDFPEELVVNRSVAELKKYIRRA